MKKLLIVLAVLIVLGGIAAALFIPGGLSAVTAAAQAQTTPEPTLAPVLAGNEIIAEGSLIPNQTVELSFNTGGLVAEVLVAEGEAVQEGQPLARLQNQEQLEASIAAARLELVNAEQALKDLTDSLNLQRAEAQQQVANAQKALQDAERYLANVTSSGDPADIDAAKAAVILAKDRLDKAKKNYRPYENKAEDNLIRASLLAQLSDAQKNYDRLVARLNNLGGTANATTVAQAEADLAVAQAALEEAQKTYEMYQNGPDPDAVAVAEARLENAQAQLAAAEAAKASLELKAPFAGTVVSVDLKTGQYVNPGVPVFVLADFSTWQVETSDLTELNVVDLQPGDAATVSFDALPGEQFPAVVTGIKARGENRQGDIVYTVTVEPDPADAWEAWDGVLRWNMTASVSIEPGD